MGLPAVDNAYVSEALALLTGQFSALNAPNLRNLLTASANQRQTLETTLWNVIDAQLLCLAGQPNGPSGQALNQLGDLVGLPRGAFNDTQYALFISVIVAARKSGGRSEDLLKVCQLALGLNAFSLNEYYPGRVDIYAAAIANDDYASPLSQALRLARPPAVFVEFTYYDAPSYHLPIFVLGDSVSGTGGSGFQDQVSGANPTVPVSSLVC